MPGLLFRLGVRGLSPGKMQHWVHTTLLGLIGREMMVGRSAGEVSREALGLLDDMEDLLSQKVLNYAVRAVE